MVEFDDALLRSSRSVVPISSFPQDLDSVYNDTSLLGTIPNGINNNGVDTPNFASGDLEINTNPRNGKPAFNTTAFSLPSLGQIGAIHDRMPVILDPDSYEMWLDPG